jgi:beta-lactamase class A
MENRVTLNMQSGRPKRKILNVIICISFVYVGMLSSYIVIQWFIDSFVYSKSEAMSTSQTPSIPSSSETTPIAVDTVLVEVNRLKNVVDNALEGTKGTYGIVIKNLKTGETYSVNEHTVFDTGSLYKLWIMATVYSQIQNDKIKENQVLSQDVVTLNQKFRIDQEGAEQTEGTVTFTVHDALNQMITVSHNYAALLLSEKIRLSSVEAFLKEHTLNESIVGTTGGIPTATPYDIALFLEKLYKGELANQQYTNDMISLLKNQQLNNGLPKLLPDTLAIAHKTGEIENFKHDAGIVFADFGDYIILVMSKSDFPLVAQERIALVSKGVFDYFNR